MANSDTFKNQGHWLERKRRQPSKFEYSREQAVRDWVGEESAASVFADLRPVTPSLTDLVDKAIEKFDLEEVALIDTLRTNWTTVATPSIAAVSWPENIVDGILVISVKNATWRYVLDVQQKPMLLKHLQRQFRDKIKGIKIIAK